MHDRWGCQRIAAGLVGAGLLLCTANPAWADDRITLVGGDAIHGQVIEETADNIIFEHEVLGRMVIARSNVLSIRLEGEPEPEAPDPEGAIEAEATEPEEAPEEEATVEDEIPDLVEWESRFEAGFNGSEGRTEQLDARVIFNTEKRTDETRFAFDANYRTSSSRGDRTQNKFDTGAIHDWYFPDSPWLAFVQGRVELDEFAAYDIRYSAGGGFGYTFVKNEDTELVGRVGLGASMEDGGPNDGEITPEGIFKLDLTHQLTDMTKFIAGAEYYPDLEMLGDYRAVLSAAIETKLASDSPASVKFGVRQELENYSDSNREDLLEYFGLFVIEF